MRTVILKERLSLLDNLDDPETQDPVGLEKKLDVLRQIAEALVEEIEDLSPLRALDLDVAHGIDLPEEIREFEKSLILSAVKHTRGQETPAAKLLGIGLTTLNAKLRRFGISPNRIGNAPPQTAPPTQGDHRIEMRKGGPRSHRRDLSATRKPG